jgi:cell wall-associated NlpC family hydrolase
MPSEQKTALLRGTKAFCLLLSLLLIASMALAPLAAYGEPTSAEKQAEADEAYARLQAAEAEAFAATEVYYAALDAHDAAVAAMTETQVRIDDFATQIANRQSQLSNRATSMYRSGQTSYLDVLFGVASFWEFIAVWDILNNINNQDAKLINEVKTLKEQSQKAYEEYSHQESIAQQKLVESEEAKVVLDAKAASTQALYDSLSAEVVALLAAEEEARQAAEQERQRQQTIESVVNGGSGDDGGGSYYEGGSGPYASVADAALSRVGKPYNYGATGPDAFDCSGLVVWSYREVGLTPPPRNTENMLAAARGIYPVSEAQYGDILYTPGHVGISLGGNSYVHAPDIGLSVCVRDNASSAFVYVLRFS